MAHSTQQKELEAQLWAMFAAYALGKRKADQAALAADLLLKEYKKRYPGML